MSYSTLLYVVTALSFLSIAGMSELRTSLLVSVLLINGAMWSYPHIKKLMEQINKHAVEGERQLRVGNYKEAEEFLTRALAEKAGKKGALRKRVALLGNLAEAQRKQGKFADSERTIGMVSALTSKLTGQSAELHGECLEALAAVREDQGNFPQMQRFLHESLSAEENLPRPKLERLARRRHKLAMAYHRAGDFTRASGQFAASFEMYSNAFGPEHFETGKALAELGAALQTEGNYAEATAKLRQALAILEKTSGNDSPDVADTLYQLALAAEHSGDAPKAVKYMERLVSLRERLVGPRESKGGFEFFYLASLYLDLGNLARAEEAALCAIPILERNPGPELAHGFETMATIYTRAGRTHDAEEANSRAREIWRVIGVKPPAPLRGASA